MAVVAGCAAGLVARIWQLKAGVSAAEPVCVTSAIIAEVCRLCLSRHRRHTFALNYLRQNPGKLVDLASLLGHESLDTTAIYTRPSKEELAADLERSRFNVY